jgi:hypothetical protein
MLLTVIRTELPEEGSQAHTALAISNETRLWASPDWMDTGGNG